MSKLLQRISTHPVVMRMMVKTVPPIDRFVHRVSGGRFTMSGTARPIGVLTTTGSRSGLPRDNPLQCCEHDGGFLVIGSNFAQPHHPAWTTNLMKNPSATLTVKGRRIPVTATLLTGPEREEAWQALLRQWPAFADYVVQAPDREFRIFRLKREN